VGDRGSARKNAGAELESENGAGAPGERQYAARPIFSLERARP